MQIRKQTTMWKEYVNVSKLYHNIADINQSNEQTDSDVYSPQLLLCPVISEIPEVREKQVLETASIFPVTPTEVYLIMNFKDSAEVKKWQTDTYACRLRHLSVGKLTD